MNASASLRGIVSRDDRPHRAHAVDDAEVHRFGHAALRLRHLRFTHLEDLRGHGRVDVAILREGGRAASRRRRSGPGAATRSANSRRSRVVQPSCGMNALRSCAPCSVRAGIFCKFGSLELRRPVSAAAWLNDVWTRPVFPFTSVGRTSTYVFFSLVTCRYCDQFLGQFVAEGREPFERFLVGARLVLDAGPTSAPADSVRRTGPSGVP